METEKKIEITKNQDQTCNDNETCNDNRILAEKYKKIIQFRSKVMTNMKIELTARGHERRHDSNNTQSIFAEKYFEYCQ